MDLTLRPIGHIRSPLQSRKDCPKQGSEGAPDAWLDIDSRYADALEGLAVGDKIIVLTWLHLGRRETLRVHPLGDREVSERGVFATRSPDRPNPIGLHEVEILEIDGTRLRIGPIETVDGTPVIDIKPVLC